MRKETRNIQLLATAAGLAAAGSAQASIIYYNVDDTAATTDSSLYVDFENGTVLSSTGDYDDLEFRFDSSNSDKPIISGENGATIASYDDSTMLIDLVDKIAGGSSIDGDLSYNSEAFLEYDDSEGSEDADSEWDGGTTGYMAVKFASDSDSESYYYGWVQLEYDDANGSVTVLDFAYEDSGEAIIAGVIPEPASILLIALGGTAALGLRRFVL